MQKSYSLPSLLVCDPPLGYLQGHLLSLILLSPPPSLPSPLLLNSSTELYPMKKSGEGPGLFSHRDLPSK